MGSSQQDPLNQENWFESSLAMTKLNYSKKDKNKRSDHMDFKQVQAAINQENEEKSQTRDLKQKRIAGPSLESHVNIQSETCKS